MQRTDWKLKNNGYYVLPWSVQSIQLQKHKVKHDTDGKNSHKALVSLVSCHVFTSNCQCMSCPYKPRQNRVIIDVLSNT